MYPPLCGSGWILCIRGFSAAVWEWPDPVHTWSSHRASLCPKRPGQDQRDSGVSAAVREWLDPMHTWFSHGASLSPKRPRQDWRDSGFPSPFPHPHPYPSHTVPLGLGGCLVLLGRKIVGVYTPFHSAMHPKQNRCRSTPGPAALFVAPPVEFNVPHLKG